MKSFRTKDGSGQPPGPGRNGERNFRTEKRSNQTHASTTDPDARLYRKADGQESRLCYLGHALMENRNGLRVDACLTHATGSFDKLRMRRRAEGRSDHAGPSPTRQRITLGADKLFDVEAFVGELRARRVSPHIAINGGCRRPVRRTGPPSSFDRPRMRGRTTRHPGYAVSLRCRKRIEEAFGWIKAQAGLRQVKLRGRVKVGALFTFATAAYNLVRLPKLMVTSAA